MLRQQMKVLRICVTKMIFLHISVEIVFIWEYVPNMMQHIFMYSWTNDHLQKP